MPTDGGASRVEEEDGLATFDPPLGTCDVAPLLAEVGVASPAVAFPVLAPLEDEPLEVGSSVPPVGEGLSSDLSRTRVVKVVGPTSVTELYSLNRVSMKTSRVVGDGRATDIVHEPATRSAPLGVMVV